MSALQCAKAVLLCHYSRAAQLNHAARVPPNAATRRGCHRRRRLAANRAIGWGCYRHRGLASPCSVAICHLFSPPCVCASRRRLPRPLGRGICKDSLKITSLASRPQHYFGKKLKAGLHFDIQSDGKFTLAERASQFIQMAAQHFCTPGCPPAASISPSPHTYRARLIT